MRLGAYSRLYAVMEVDMILCSVLHYMDTIPDTYLAKSVMSLRACSFQRCGA